MEQHRRQTLTLSLNMQVSFLHVVTRFVEAAASVFGLGKSECLKLTLATEEIFIYLCNGVSSGKSIEIQCVNGVYYARVLFRFSSSDLNLKGLNITSTMTGDGETVIEEMGLMIAARSVDRLNIAIEIHQTVCLVIDKEKDYPSAPEISFPQPDTDEEITIGIPDTEGQKGFAMRVAQSNTDPLMPSYFRYPGKVADMVGSGEYQALVALSPRQEIAGGILYCFPTERMVQALGPFVFQTVHGEAISEKLLEAFIARIARTKAIGIINTTGLPESLHSHFETLGFRTYYGSEGEPVRQPCFYRMLHEDPGCVVWTHADLKGYLGREYDRLILAREIKTVRDFGENRSGASIFSAEIRRERCEAILRPIWPGEDFVANVGRHIQLLTTEGLVNIFFEIDTGISWHAALIPALLTHRFKPGMILPFAGQADLVVFQYHAT